MVKKKFIQNLIIKKFIIKVVLSLLIAFLITLISTKLQKKEYSDVQLRIMIDRDVRMELSLLPTAIYQTKMEGILLSDNIKLKDFIINDLNISQNCSFAQINNDLFLNIKINANEVELDFISTNDIDIENCINEVNGLLNSMVIFYFKNQIRHKKKSIEVMEIMQQEYELSGSLVNAIIDLEILNNLISNKDKFFVNSYKITDNSKIDRNLIFITLFITIFFLLNLSFVTKLLNIKKK